MSLPHVHHAFLQRAMPEGCEEVWFADGQVGAISGRRVDEPRVIRRGGALERFRAASAMLLKNSARLIYASPLLLIAKLIVKVFDQEASDYLIVAFVGVVLVFFAALNLYIIASVLFWIWGRDQGSYALERPFESDDAKKLALEATPGEGALEALGATPLPVGRRVGVRGRVTRLGPEPAGDGSVLYDVWSSDGTLRLLEAIDFAVVAPGRVPAVVRIKKAPVVISNPSTMYFGGYLAQSSGSLTRLFERAGVDGAAAAQEECSVLTLREGDEVDVTGVVVAGIDNVDGFDLDGALASVPLPPSDWDGASTPFRDRPGGPGVVLGERVIIRRIA